MFSLIIGSRREETIKFNLKEDLNEEKQTIHIKGTKTKTLIELFMLQKNLYNF